MRHGRRDQEIREAMTDNVECDSADHSHVNAPTAGQVLVERDHGEHDTGQAPGSEPAREQFLSLNSVVDCIDGIL